MVYRVVVIGNVDVTVVQVKDTTSSGLYVGWG